MCKRPIIGLLAFFLLAAILTAACGADVAEAPADEEVPGMTMGDLPDDLDTATTRITDDGAFEVTITSELDPLAINAIHSWIIHVEMPDGQLVEDATISVDGGMPQHNHGFPTAPEVTEELGGGDYRLEGVRFSMTGWWELKLTIEAGGQSDSVTFNIVL